jgi:lysophospholipase L1-like esterase
MPPLPAHGFFWAHLALLTLATTLAILLFRAWRRPSAPRLVAGNVVLTLLLLQGAVTAGEGWFQFVHDATDGALVTLASRRWMERHVRTSFMGTRGTPPPQSSTPRRPGEVRIAALGDSYTFGQGIEREVDRWPEILESLLRREGVEASVYNLAKQGWDTAGEAESLEALRRDGITFDLVVLALVPNDHFGHDELPEAYQRAADGARNPPPLRRFLTGRSLFLDHLYHRLVTFRDPALKGYDRLALDLFRRPGIPARQEILLREILATCREEGAGLAAVTFPLMFGRWEDYLLGEMHQWYARVWRELGVPHLDLLPSFRRHPPAELAASPLDAHPNEQAHRLAAEAILPLVRQALAGRERGTVPQGEAGGTGSSSAARR